MHAVYASNDYLESLKVRISYARIAPPWRGVVLAINLPCEIEERLDALTARTGRTT